MAIKDIVAYSQQSNDRNEENKMPFEELWWDFNATLINDKHIPYLCAIQVFHHFVPGAPGTAAKKTES